MPDHPLHVHIRELSEGTVRLRGKLAVKDLGLESGDELIHLNHPLEYDLVAERMDEAMLVQGGLKMVLDCECSRCLKPYPYLLDLGHWACHVQLEGEECVTLVGDAVDLTPYILEDIVLAFPQHPLCESKCTGLPSSVKDAGGTMSVDLSPDKKSAGSIWDELDKLKLR